MPIARGNLRRKMFETIYIFLSKTNVKFKAQAEDNKNTNQRKSNAKKNTPSPLPPTPARFFPKPVLAASGF